MKDISVEELVKLFDMQPHPEGGYYKETYRSSLSVSGTYAAQRQASTAIYYLLPSGAKSRFHRLPTDEIFHFYLGDPMTVVEINPSGQITETVLGSDVRNGQMIQHVIPAGNWFGGLPNPHSRYSLVGCTVAPGFEFEDLEIATQDQLLILFPHAQSWIKKLTMDSSLS